MEYKVSKTGKKTFSVEAKKRILSELDKGRSPAEVSREYEVPLK